MLLILGFRRGSSKVCTTGFRGAARMLVLEWSFSTGQAIQNEQKRGGNIHAYVHTYIRVSDVQVASIYRFMKTLVA